MSVFPLLALFVFTGPRVFLVLPVIFASWRLVYTLAGNYGKIMPKSREAYRVQAKKRDHAFKKVTVSYPVAFAFEQLVASPALLREANAAEEIVGSVEALLPVGEELVLRLAEASEDAVENPKRHPAHGKLIQIASEASALREAAQKTEEARIAASRLALPAAQALPTESLIRHGEAVFAEQREMELLRVRLDSSGPS